MNSCSTISLANEGKCQIKNLFFLHPNNFYLIEAGLRSIDLDDNVDKHNVMSVVDGSLLFF